MLKTAGDRTSHEKKESAIALFVILNLPQLVL